MRDTRDTRGGLMTNDTTAMYAICMHVLMDYFFVREYRGTA